MSRSAYDAGRMVAVPYRPYKYWALVGFFTLLTALGCVGGFFFAADRVQLWQQDLTAQRDNLVDQLMQTVDDNEQLNNQLAVIGKGADIDREAAIQLQRQLHQQQSLVSELREELSFYRNLMNPQEGQIGLDVYRFLVYGLVEDRRYRYRLVLQQLGTDQKFITVSIKVDVSGSLNGEAQVYSMDQLVPSVESWDESVRFRYYHNHEGQMQLPEGFVPSTVEVSVKENRKATKVYTYRWSDVENPYAG